MGTDALTATVYRFTVSDTVDSVLSYSNPSRKSLSIFNEVGRLFIKLGVGVSPTDYTVILTKGAVIYFDGYRGRVTAIKELGSSPVQVTEFF